LAEKVTVVVDILAKRHRGHFLWDTLYTAYVEYYSNSNSYFIIKSQRQDVTKNILSWTCC